ncbi:MAG: aspartyl/asparaginyl beta-hydroxylase domain-containing protein [Pseudomonadota bacterium]
MSTETDEKFARIMNAANAALRAKDAANALALLSEAQAVDPKQPDVHFNKSVAYELMNDPNAAMAAIDAALEIQPYHLPAKLAKARLLEESGRNQAAAVIYRSALTFAPEESRLPPPLAKSVQHAHAAVEADNARLRAYIVEQVDGIYSKYGRSETKRFDECVQIFTGAGRPYFPQPTLLYFPALPPVSYFERSLFPWIEEFEASTEDIRRDLRSILNSPAADEFSPYINYPPGAPVNQWGQLNKSKRWSSYFFWKDGSRNEDAHQRAPKTGAAIGRAPLFDAPGFGPAAFFSSLAAHSHIPPHVGSSNVRSIVHLPLELPGPAWFRVGNERRDWKIGEAFVFDDSIDHEAMNEADATRTILIVDIWNPYLTQPERELVSVLLASSQHYRRNVR